MKKYDLVISLGETCLTAMTLSHLNIRTKSYPFDWSAGVIPERAGNAGFLGKINLICNYFKNAFEKEDFKEFNYAQPGEHRFVRNLSTGLQYIHDFPWNVSMDEYFTEFKEKYSRRIKRLYDDIKKSESILFIFIARWSFLPLEDIVKGSELLKSFFADKKINLLILQHDNYMDKFSYKEFYFLKDITYIKYNDYDLMQGRQFGNFVMLRRICCKHILDADYISFLYEDVDNIGLSTKEDVARWSMSKHVLIKIPYIYKEGMSILFNIIPFINEKVPHQNITIKANGKNVGNWNFVFGQEYHSASIDIPKDALMDSDELYLEFFIPNAASPYELELSNDIRTVGIGFIDMIIKKHHN